MMARRWLELLIFLFSVAATTGCAPNYNNASQSQNVDKNAQTAYGLSLEIPDALWEPAFFENLNERTKKAGISSLRQTVLRDDNLEVRFWFDHFEVINGVIIRRSGQKWSATYLRQRQQNQSSSLALENLGVPKSGWEAAWRRLTTAGILTLPDESTTNCKSEALDGIGYVVETNLNGKYRTYRYGNPQLADCDEAKRILSIEAILSEEFNLHSPYK